MKSFFSSHSVRWLSLSMALGLLSFALPANSQTTLHALPTRHVPKVVLNGKAAVVKTATPTKLIHLDIVLRLRNQTALKKLLKQLYEPGSPKYRQFLNVDEFTKEFGPTSQQYQTAANWAKGHGFTVGKQPPDRLIVPITGTVADAELAFHFILRKYQLKSTGRLFYAPDREPTVDLSVPLWHIAGLSNYSTPHPLNEIPKNGEMANASGSGPGGSYVPWDMRAAYYGGAALTGSGQCVGLAEFDGYDLSDLLDTLDGTATATQSGNNYLVTYNPPNGGGPYSINVDNVLVDGGSLAPNGPNADAYEGEVVLDIAQVIGMAPGSQVEVYLAPDQWTSSGNYVFPSNTSDEDIFNDMAQGSCKQLSLSWNWRPESVANDLDNPIFSEIATNGQSLFAASGDGGSWPNGEFYYPEEEGELTAVGGTDLTTNGAGGSWASETAWSDSSGGVSPDDVPIPTYQQLAGFTCSGCSTSYRNVPDVAMEGDFDNYLCSLDSGVDGCIDDEGGTSYAAPRWAAFMALANQYAIQQGYIAPGNGLGFINPSIYQIGLSSAYTNDFHDITSGSNGSYSAASGYDLVTGWGSPKGQSMIDALAAGGPPPAAATPYNSSSYSTSGGVNATVTFTETLHDSTQGAEIFWTVPSCAGTVSGSDPLYSGDSFTLVYQSGTNCNPTGTMYATAPGYSQSTTTPIEFN